MLHDHLDTVQQLPAHKISNVSSRFPGDLLGGEPPAPSAAATSGGGMFAGLDVGTSDQRPSQSASVASPVAPQSPIDALASLQMPSSAQSGDHCSFVAQAPYIPTAQIKLKNTVQQ